ncbi:MAG TPA: hypothetical protein VLL48_01290, partial [Longimicrobiales bacterium]|nr:hypothetical protein [Longimicrobiales bacterium]
MGRRSFPRLRVLLAELKRRHVIRVGFAYLVVSFAVLQGADLVLPALQLPDWTFRLLVFLVLFCFPIALVLAWVYDLTPHGLTRTEEMEPEARPEEPEPVQEDVE